MMRRWSIPLATVITTLLVASAAAADCTPVPPKKWEGKITYGGGGWVGGTVFNESGCSWSGADGLNGSDTIVWEVSGYGGATASITSKESSPVHHGLQGYFLNQNCERGGSWGITERDTPYSVGIPEGAKWIVIYQQYGGYDTTVTMETTGIVCEDAGEPKPPKKKKKKPKRN